MTDTTGEREYSSVDAASITLTVSGDRWSFVLAGTPDSRSHSFMLTMLDLIEAHVKLGIEDEEIGRRMG